MNFSLAVDKCYSYLRYYVPHWIILVIWLLKDLG
jgi:hypothetical protein